MTILLSVWSVLKGSQKGGGCHEANYHSCGNGYALSGQFSSCTDQVFGCDRCAVVPVWILFSLAVAMGGDRPLCSFDELLSMAVLTASWWMLLIADL